MGWDDICSVWLFPNRNYLTRFFKYFNTYSINYQSTTSQMLHCTLLLYYNFLQSSKERKSGVNRKHNKICLWWIAVCFSFLNYFQFFIFFLTGKSQDLLDFIMSDLIIWLQTNLFLNCKKHLHVPVNLSSKSNKHLIISKKYFLLF